jgi:MFS family permease
VSAETGRRLQALLAISAADFLVVMEGFVVAVALPSIGREMGLDQAGLQWVVTAYVLAFGGFLLLAGRVADAVGRRATLVAGLVVFAAGSLVGGLAPHPAVLVAGRAVQGLGAAAMSSAALAMLAATFPEGESRSRALGIWSAVGSAGIPAGALVGGVLTQAFGWRSVLLINAPVAGLAALLAVATLQESGDDTRSRRVDVAGGITVTAGLTLLVAAVVGVEALVGADAGRAGRGGLAIGNGLVRVGVPLAASMALLAAFVTHERRRERNGGTALFPLSLLRRPGLVVGAVLPVGLGALLFLGTQLLQSVWDASPLRTGLAYLALALPTIAASPWAARSTTRFGPRRVAAVGLAMQAAGLVWLLTSAPDPAAGGAVPIADVLTAVLPAFVLVGAGAPLAFVPVTGIAVGDAGGASGVTSGVFNTAQQVGNAVAIAATAAAVAVGSRLAARPGGGAAGDDDALVAGLRSGLLLAAVLVAAGAVAARRLPAGAGRSP